MNITNDRWEIGFWQRGSGHKHPVQFSWFEALESSEGRKVNLQLVLTLRKIIRRIIPLRLDMCPVDGRIIAITLPWVGLFFRFRLFHSRCVGYTIYDLDEFHVSRWYHHPKNETLWLVSQG